MRRPKSIKQLLNHGKRMQRLYPSGWPGNMRAVLYLNAKKVFEDVAAVVVRLLFNGVDQYLTHTAWTPSGANFDIGLTYTPAAGDIGSAKTLIAGLLTKNASNHLVFTYTDVNAVVNTLTLTALTLAADTEYDITITSDGNGVELSINNVIAVSAGDYLSGNGVDVRGELNIPVTASSPLELVLIPNAGGIAQDLMAGDVSGTLLGINAGNQIVFNGLSSVTVNNSAIASGSFVVESDKSYTINALFSASENITSIHSSDVPNNFSSSILTNIDINSGEYVYKLTDIMDLGGMGLLLQTGIKDQYLTELWVKALDSFASISSRVNVADEGSGVYTLSSTGATGEHFVRDSFNFGISESVVSRVQAEFKMISHRYAGLRIAGPMYAIFDLQQGTVQSFFTTPAVIEDIGDGWYRCTLTAYTTPAFPSILMSDSSNPYNPTIPLGDSFLVRNYSYRVSTNAVVNNYDPLTDLSTIENIPAQVTDTDVIDPSTLSVDTWFSERTKLQGGEFLQGNGSDVFAQFTPLTFDADYKLEFDFVWQASGGYLAADTNSPNGNDRVLISQFEELFGPGITFLPVPGLVVGQHHKLVIARTGSTQTYSLDGKQLTSNTYSGQFTLNSLMSRFGGSTSVPFWDGFLSAKFTVGADTYEWLTANTVTDLGNGTGLAESTGNTGPSFDAIVQNFAPSDLVTLPSTRANGIPSDLSLSDQTRLQGGEFLLGNGTDIEVDIPPITLSGDFDLEFEIMFSVPPPSNKVIWGGSHTVDYYINISNGSTITFWSSGEFDAFSLLFQQNIPIKVKFEMRGNNLTLMADGKFVQTRAAKPYRSAFASKLFRSISVGAYFPGYLIFKLTKLDTGETYEYLTADSVTNLGNGTATALNTGNTGTAFDATVQNFAPSDLVALPNNSHAWPLNQDQATQDDTVGANSGTIVNYDGSMSQ